MQISWTQRQSSPNIVFSYRRVILCAVVCCQSSISAEESRLSWPFRNGPGLNSQVVASDAEDLPVEFDEQSGKNIKWKTSLEGLGHSTPVVGAGQLWLTAATEDGTQQFVYCLDADTGSVRHHKLVFENEDPEPLGQNVNTYASPSCALQDDAVFVHFGSYGTARLNAETAEIVWQRRDIECRHFRGPGSSPVIFQNLLILTFDGIDRQFLTALDTRSGKTVWKTKRSTDYGDLDTDGNPKREGDLRKAYSTPGFVEVNGRTQVVSVGSRGAYGYDVLTGKEIWGIRHGDFNAAAPPAFYNDMAILHSGSGGRNLFGVQVNETTKGDVTESHVRWNRTKGNPSLSAPILVENRVYMITSKGVASCVAADTGEEIWKDRIGGTHVASPVSANGLIYFCSEEGDTTVIRANDEFEIVAKNRLAEGMRASPAAANGRLYLRTFGQVYCIENAVRHDKPGTWVQLFNGKDLTGWTPKIRYSRPGENYGNTFRVEDGLMKVRYDRYKDFGERFGHLFYAKEFSHYRFRVEYRFVDEQCPGGPGWAIRNSGVMIHGQKPETMAKDQDFPVSIEVQLLAGNGRDPRTTSNLCTPGTNVVMDGNLKKQHCIKSSSETLHLDQWVTAEIEVRGNQVIKHILDGKVVLEYTEPQLDERDDSARKLIVDGKLALHGGTISLQSESHPCDFRKVEIMVLEE